MVFVRCACVGIHKCILVKAAKIINSVLIDYSEYACAFRGWIFSGCRVLNDTRLIWISRVFLLIYVCFHRTVRNNPTTHYVIVSVKKSKIKNRYHSMLFYNTIYNLHLGDSSVF